MQEKQSYVAFPRQGGSPETVPIGVLLKSTRSSYVRFCVAVLFELDPTGSRAKKSTSGALRAGCVVRRVGVSSGGQVCAAALRVSGWSNTCTFKRARRARESKERRNKQRRQVVRGGRRRVEVRPARSHGRTVLLARPVPERAPRSAARAQPRDSHRDDRLASCAYPRWGANTGQSDRRRWQRCETG